MRTNMLNFIDVVKEVLDEQGKSTEALFSDGVISKDTFYKYRQRDPGLKTVLMIANYLKVSVDYLFERNNENVFCCPYVYNAQTFYENLMRYIDCKKVSGRQFSKDLGYSRDNIARWKRGVMPTAKNILEIADYFGCQADDLLRG